MARVGEKRFGSFFCFFLLEKALEVVFGHEFFLAST
jgi:hypothetical protein